MQHSPEPAQQVVANACKLQQLTSATLAANSPQAESPLPCTHLPLAEALLRSPVLLLHRRRALLCVPLAATRREAAATAIAAVVAVPAAAHWPRLWHHDAAEKIGLHRASPKVGQARHPRHPSVAEGDLGLHEHRVVQAARARLVEVVLRGGVGGEAIRRCWRPQTQLRQKRP